MSYTQKVREVADPYWEGSFQHPFITELQEGTLPEAAFRYYLLQDRYYLEHFGKLYGLIAEATDDIEVRQMMQENAMNLKTGELAIREGFFKELGITDEEIAKTPIAPTAYNYVSHMYRQLVEGSPQAAMAGILPCVWLYQEIGCRLISEGSPNLLYQRWIETYAGVEAAETILKERAVLDRLYAESTEKEQSQMEIAFMISSQMEYLFWEMAYIFEKWPEGVKGCESAK